MLLTKKKETGIIKLIVSSPNINKKEKEKIVKNIVLTLVGLFFLALGFIGLFLPVWPTTPFVLVSVGCLGANPKIQKKVLKVSYVRQYVNSYYHQKGLPTKTMVMSLVFLWGMLILSMVTVKKSWLTLLLVAIGFGVTLHIIWIGKMREKRKKSHEE